MRALPIRLVSVLCALSAAFGRPCPAAAQGPIDELRRLLGQLPPGFLDLTDIDVITGDDGTVTVTAATSLMGARTDLLMSLSTAAGARGYTLALRPDDWSLAKALPQLQNPVLDGLTLSNVALVLTGDSVRRSSGDLAGGSYEFYRDVYQTDDYTLILRPGLNLIASIPVARLPPDHPLLSVMDALGIERGVVLVQGTLGKSLTMLASPGAGGMDVVRDLYLRAELPPMRPPNSPEWFRSGQLALEITGDPSFRLVGEMTVRIEDEEPTFSLAAMLARSGVSLAGGLTVDGGWQSPFGIQWLTLNKVILSIGITPTGSVQLGFAGDMVIGKRDIATAIAIALSPVGAPTNFIFDGKSDTGFGLSDLLDLQAKMAAARAAAREATGVSGPLAGASIPLDALPQVEFRDIALKFAPKAEPSLGVEQGMAIKGRMLLPTGGDGSLKEVAAVDVSVGEDGIRAKGNVAAFQVGPLSWEDALVDMELSGQEQHLRLKGDVRLFTARQKVDLEMSRTSLRFSTVSELYGQFRAQIDATAAFDLRQPKFQVRAVAEADLAEALDPIIRGGATAFVRTSGVVVEQSESAIRTVRGALDKAEATAVELRAALEQARSAAQSKVEAEAERANQLAAAAQAAARARDRARSLWSGTPLRQVSLRASRRAAWAAAIVRYNAAAARYAAQLAVVASLRRVVAAIPPVDENVALLAADRAAAVIRGQLEGAEQALNQLRQRHDAVAAALAQGGTLLAINLAEVNADLERLRRGEALEWRLAGVFVNTPFDVTETVSFSDMAEAGGAILSRLVGG